MSPTDINTRCTTALRALEGARVIRSAWLPGMVVLWSLDEDPVMPLRLTEDSSDGHTYTGNPVWSGVRSDREYNAHELDPEWCRLDLSDPVTAASLLPMVREAWGDPKIHTRFSESKQRWEVVRGRDKATQPTRWPGDKRGRIISDAVLEVEALVAALEAKVREVCGG